MLQPNLALSSWSIGINYVPMKSKSSSSRKFEIDVIQLHHSTGRQREELMARLLYEVLLTNHEPKYKKSGKQKKSGPSDLEAG
jgi:hypothetical protein